jgi:hypothetical protein
MSTGISGSVRGFAGGWWRGVVCAMVMMLATVEAVGAPVLRWVQERATLPLPRQLHSMVFDSRRGVAVMFGGTWSISAGLGERLDETWEWDGAEWTQRRIPGAKPSARAEHAMVYDSERGVTVMFGGQALTVSRETWEYDGAAWRLRTSTGPTPRYGHAMAYDSVRRETVLFGGWSNSVVNAETWLWNGETWRQVTPATSPTPRSFHAMVFDGARGETVMFGGVGSAGTQTWVWNGTTWTRRDVANGPAARSRHAMAYDPVRGEVHMHGGDVFPSPDGLNWVWNGTGWTQRNAAPHRTRQAMAWDTVRGAGVKFGGSNGVELDSTTWIWNGSTWTNVADQAPSGRFAFGMAYDEERRRLVLAGGFAQMSLETWELARSTWRRFMVTGPSNRWYDMSMAYVPERGQVMAFGGVGAGGLIGDLWGWNGETWTLAHAGGPPARSEHAMVYDSLRRKLVLFGGLVVVDSAVVRDAATWEWDGNAWTLRATQGPPARADHAMAFDRGRGVTVLFGGASLGGEFGDTWEWNGTAWMQRFAAGPSPRRDHAMAYLPGSGVVMFGGSSGTTFSNETWAWDGSVWRRPEFVAQFAPAVRVEHALVSDTDRNVLVLQGGQTQSDFTPGTWLITCAADFNLSGAADFFDYLDFVSAFEAEDESADLDRNRSVDFFDYLEFVAAFAVGCG